MLKYIFLLFTYFICYTGFCQPETLSKKVDALITEGKLNDAETIVTRALQNIKTQQSATLLNQTFALYITTLKAYKNAEEYESFFSSYKKITAQPFYKQVHDSLQAQGLLEYGITLNYNGQSLESINVYKDIQTKYSHILKNDVQFQALLFIELSYSYSSFGNQKNEIDYVVKAIELMEANFSKIKEMDFLIAYNNLFYYYGEYDAKEEQLTTCKKFSNYYLSHYKNGSNSKNFYYAKRVYRKMQIVAATLEDNPAEAIQLLKLMKQEMAQLPSTEKKEEVSYYLSCLSAVANYYNFYSTDNEGGIKAGNAFLQEAIAQKDSFNIMLAHSKLANQYREMEDYDKALFHITASLNSFRFPEKSMSKFGLETMKAMNLSSTQKHQDAIAIMERNILSIIEKHTKKQINIQDINPTQLKDLNNSRYINIFATSALIFVDAYKQTNDKLYIFKAEKLAQTAATMFSEFYRKGSYNSTLSSLQNKIIEAYLFIAVNQYSSNFQQKKNILQTIEGNTSFHLAKEFEQKILRTNSIIGSLMNEQQLLQQEKEFYTAQQIEVGNKENYSTKIKLLTQQLTQKTQELNNATKQFTNLLLKDFSVNACLELLNKDEAIIKFYVAQTNVYRVTFTKGDINVELLGNKKEVEIIAQNYLTALKQIKPNYSATSTQLYTALLKGINTVNATIIPDNYLNYIPFESLQNPTTKQFFLTQTNINYNYSLSLWYLHKVMNTSNKKIALASFAPTYSNATFNSITLMNLPFAQQEANAITALFNGKTYSGSVATKKNFLINYNQYNILHCSMHSVLFDNDFNKSCLLFSNAQPLYFKELYTTAIAAEMVVLSACNTGAGKLLDGEGMMSLSRAFTYSGVKSTVVSLWQVPDKETSDLMILFYKHLKKGLTKSNALTEAKKEFIETYPLKNHPYYWSGFILTGNEDAITNSTNLWWYVLATLAIAAIVFLILKKKKTIHKPLA
jgi:CHAT domain-containing protein